MRHHDEANLRPQFMDHMLATMLIGTVSGFLALNTLTGALQGLMVSTCAIGPGLYWVKQCGPGFMEHTGPANIFYTDDTTPEEVERIRMEDEVEMLAYNMSKQPGYGIIHKGRSAFGIGL